MKIAICDENIDDMEKLSQIINVWFLVREYSVELSKFTDGEEILQAYQQGQQFDVVFLGDHQQGMTGIEIGRQLRKQDKKMELFFAVKTAEFAVQGYSIGVKQYFLKPIKQNKKVIFQMLDEEYEKLLIEKKKTLWIKTLNKKIYFSDILYIESNGKNVIVHTKNEITYHFLSKLSQVETELDQRFLRCNRSYIINMESVMNVKTDFIMENGETIPIKVRKRKEIKDKYYNYMD